MVIKLGMVFEDTAPDFGDIEYDKNNNFILTNSSVVKLITNLTADVCGNAFNIPIGTKALVADTGAIYIYHANDRWYLRESQKFDPDTADDDSIADKGEWKNPETHHSGYCEVKIQHNNENYLLASDEKIVFTIKDFNNNIILSKEMTYIDYMGSGYYVRFYSIMEAKKLHLTVPYGSDCILIVSVFKGNEDITNSFTITNYDFTEWYSKYKPDRPVRGMI